jgi:hypothetical protein
MKNIRLEFDQEIAIRKREKNDFMKEMEDVGNKIKNTYSIIETFLDNYDKLSDITA